MKKLRWGVVSVCVMAGLAAVLPAQNFYVALRGAPSWVGDRRSESQVNGVPGTSMGIAESGTGYAAGGALGYSFESGVSAEGEFSFVHNPVNRVNGLRADGSIHNYLYMANLGYTFGQQSSSPLKPFVGFGLGVAKVTEDYPYEDAGVLVPDLDKLTKFAYHLRAGLAFQISAPVDLSVGYRFLRTNGNEAVFGDGTGSSKADGIPHHMLEFGLRFRF